jgi:hypothetical protein
MSLVDVLGDLGGMFSSLSLIGLILNLTFSYDLLLSSLIRKLYHFKPRFDEEMKKKKKKSKDHDKNAPKTQADDMAGERALPDKYDGDSDEERQASLMPYDT